MGQKDLLVGHRCHLLREVKVEHKELSHSGFDIKISFDIGVGGCPAECTTDDDMRIVPGVLDVAIRDARPRTAHMIDLG